MSRSSRDLKGHVALDSSVLIEMAYATSLAEFVRASVESGQAFASTSKIALTELFYVICRRLGSAVAAKKVASLIESRYVAVLEPSDLHILAGEVKCERAISLEDSYVIALAKSIKGKAVFARREEDILKEIERKSFEMEVVFVEDLISASR